MSFSKDFEPHYQQSHAWSQQSKREAVDEDDDMNILDSKILDADTPQYPLSGDLRHQSIDQSSAMDTTGTMVWSDSHQQHLLSQQRYQMQGSIPVSDHVDAAHLDHQQPYFLSTNGTWGPTVASGTCTPTPTYTPTQQEFDEQLFPQNRAAASMFDQRQFHSAPGFSLPASIPMSPQSSQGWMSTTSSDPAETHSRSFASPTARPSSPATVQRRDGVRKKNAKFEIPKERNLDTIDDLIAYYAKKGDEAQVKELKQQKRLLRNRQAALDSRQRKKQHTEELEKEKVQTSEYIKRLEEELETYKANVSELLFQQAQWRQEEDQLQSRAAFLEQQSNDFVRTATLEAEDLRRQNNILCEHVKELEREQAIFHANPNLGNFDQFNNLEVDGSSDWNGYGIHPAVKVDPSNGLLHPSQAAPPAEPASTRTAHSSLTVTSKNDLPFSWNTFYMCLLFGAFIVSNTKPSTSSGSNLTQPSSITLPALSQEYKDESANVLKTFLGSTSPSPSSGNTQGQSQSATISASEMAEIHRQPTNTLSNLHSSLTTYTRTQQEMQAFSLSPTMYASMAGMDSQHHDSAAYLPNFSPSSSNYQMHPPAPRQPTPLQQAFTALKSQQDQIDRTIMPGAWDRSAVASTTGQQATMGIWEQLAGEVPEKVVRDFRNIIGAVENGEKEMSNH